MQTAAPGQYKGALDVVRQTIARDGVKGFVCFITKSRERERELEEGLPRVEEKIRS